MRVTATIAGLFLCTLIFLSNSTVSADAPKTLALKDVVEIENSLTVLETDKKEEPKQEVKEVPKPQTHVVATGESLAAISQQYGTTWQRLYAKNVQIADPNVIKVGETVVVPLADEQLAERSLPQPVVAPQPGPAAPASQPKSVTASAPRGSSSGNTYSPGYCTWYAKSRRPDLPNNLGNADTWVARAAAQGLPTGSAPRAGAIGQQGMHVVYVERVNGDGTVFISEMNYRGYGVVSTRTVPASTFLYIY